MCTLAVVGVSFIILPSPSGIFVVLVVTATLLLMLVLVLVLMLVAGGRFHVLHASSNGGNLWVTIICGELEHCVLFVRHDREEGWGRAGSSACLGVEMDTRKAFCPSRRA